MFMTPEEIAKDAIWRGVSKFWSVRIREMADQASTVSGYPHGDRTVQGLRITAIDRNFPNRGTIEVEREDGVRFTFRNSRSHGFLVTQHPRGR